jgi:hypothetical protein
MCRAGGRRCPGHGYSTTRANVAARQRLRRARRAFSAARAGGDQEALRAAARRFTAAQAAVLASTTAHKTDREAGGEGGDVTSGRDYTVAGSGALIVPAGEPVQVRRLSGQTAHTDLLTYPDGRRVVRKDHSRLRYAVDDDAELVAYSDAEELAPLVLAAAGLTAAKVRRTGRDEIHVEFVDGDSGETLTPWGGDVDPQILTGADGRALGLADVLLANADRNPGNWILTADGRLVDIDHGSAFWSTTSTTSPFAAAAIAAGISDDELAGTGQRLAVLRPAFEQRGRSDWYEAMMRRHHDLTTGHQSSIHGVRQAPGDVTTAAVA